MRTRLGGTRATTGEDPHRLVATLAGVQRIWIRMQTGGPVGSYPTGPDRVYVLLGRPIVGWEERGRTRAEIERFYHNRVDRYWSGT